MIMILNPPPYFRGFVVGKSLSSLSVRLADLETKVTEDGKAAEEAGFVASRRYPERKRPQPKTDNQVIQSDLLIP